VSGGHVAPLPCWDWERHERTGWLVRSGWFFTTQAEDHRFSVPKPLSHALRNRRIGAGRGPCHRLINSQLTTLLPLVEPELPMTVKEAARCLGVSPQTVYLWVERKQIPHLRVMGRNIRFLRTDLEPFRATFKQEVGFAQTE